MKWALFGVPLLGEIVALTLLLVPSVSSDLGLIVLAALFLGIPIAFLVVAGLLAATSAHRLAAISAAVGPIVLVFNLILFYAVCMSDFSHASGGSLP